MDLEFADTSQNLYICPGETAPISYSVHLARLARMYPACQDCPLSCDAGTNSATISRKLADKRDRASAELSRSFGSIRGVYLNQITRRVAHDVVGEFAQQLWEDTHRVVRTHRRERIEQWTAPTVVIGYDQRPSSPDVVTGVQDGLRVMGCDVIDQGLTTGPELQFGILHNRATSGILVTGSGHSPSWTGFDFFDHNALPRNISDLTVPRPSEPPRKHSRPVRWSGQHRFSPVSSEFTKRIQQHLRPSRSVRVVVGTQDQVATDHFRHVLGRLPDDDVMLAPLPKRVRDITDPEDADTRRVAETMLATSADLGFVVDEDARHFAVVDNEGEHITTAEVAKFLDPSAMPVAATNTDAKTLYGPGWITFRSKVIRNAASLTLVRLITALSRRAGAASELLRAESAC